MQSPCCWANLSLFNYKFVLFLCVALLTEKNRYLVLIRCPNFIPNSDNWLRLRVYLRARFLPQHKIGWMRSDFFSPRKEKAKLCPISWSAPRVMMTSDQLFPDFLNFPSFIPSFLINLSFSLLPLLKTEGSSRGGKKGPTKLQLDPNQSLHLCGFEGWDLGRRTFMTAPSACA